MEISRKHLAMIVVAVTSYVTTLQWSLTHVKDPAKRKTLEEYENLKEMLGDVLLRD